MIDITDVYYVLIFIYLIECGLRINAGSFVFVARVRPGGRWRMLGPGELYAAGSHLLFMGNPLPPFGAVCAAPVAPGGLSFDEAGFTDLQFHCLDRKPRAAGAGEYCAYDAIESVEPAGRELRINGRLFAKLDSEVQARYACGLLRELKARPAAARLELLQNRLEQALDVNATRARFEQFSGFSFWLRLCAAFFFVFLFLALPGVVLSIGLDRSWPGLLLAFVVLFSANASLFFHAHLRLYGELRAERWIHLIAMLLSPQLAIRSADILARDLFADYAYPVVARLLLDDSAWREAAMRAWRDLEHPAMYGKFSLDGRAIAVAEWYRQTILRDAFTRFFLRHGVESPAFTSVDSRENSNDARSFCPRCWSVYSRPTGDCADCRIALRALPTGSG